MSDNRTILVVSGGAVVDARVAPSDAVIAKGGASVVWSDGSFPAADGVTYIEQDGAGIRWVMRGGTLVAPSETSQPQPSVADLASRLVQAAAAVCAEVTDQVVPDATHQQAYQNAATIVWANGGGAPTADPAKSIFAAHGASVGIADPTTFANVVVAVSLGSMQLATILGTLKAAAVKAQSSTDLTAALAAFETSVAGFVTHLNATGLTVAVAEPAPISIPDINA